MFTNFWSFVAIERDWLWLFRTVVLPAFLGKDMLLPVVMIVTNGDSQEGSQLENALVKNYIPRTQRLHCG